MIATLPSISKYASVSSVSSVLGNWDILALIIFAVVAIGLGFMLGKNRLNLILISAYFSFLILKIIPWTKIPYIGLKSAPAPSALVFVFLGIIALLFLFLPHSFFGLRSSRRGKAAWWQVVVYSVLVFGMLTNMIISFVPMKFLTDFGPLVKQVFTTQESQFIWLILPIIGAMLLRKRKSTIEE